jgi:CHAD domain-containing protein
MKREKIKRIIAEGINKLGHTARKSGDFENEHIHDFRVGIKSLRAFLRLLINYTGNSDYKLPGKIKTLYDIAGTIRDYKLELEKIAQLEMSFVGYTDHLSYQIELQESIWNLQYPTQIFTKMEGSFSTMKLARVPPGALSWFINDNLQAIGKILLLEDITDDELHHIRKLIKDIIYTTEIGETHWKPAYKLAGDPGIEELKQMAASIGDYNDDRLLVEHLLAFPKNNATVDEKPKIEATITNIANQLPTRKQEILVQVKTYMALKAGE